MIGSILAADYAFDRAARPLQTGAQAQPTPLAGERGAQAAWPRGCVLKQQRGRMQMDASNPVTRGAGNSKGWRQ
jgi:hypothetical protein